MIKKPFQFQDLLLYPLSIVFGAVVWVRNILFDFKILKSREFDIPVISVGNITVGGTGKTPHVEYLLGLLAPEFKVAVLSRGYKRKTHGFFLASEQSTAFEIGDEPCQIKQAFPDAVVAVDANRAKGIEKLLRLDSGIKAILLDDAFQHRYVTPGLSILLVDYNRPVFDDFLLPYGRLRELPPARSRADIIVVTKCPADLKPIDQRLLEKRLKMYAYQKIYFSHLVYGTPQPVFNDLESSKSRMGFDNKKMQLVVLAGIADATPFIEYLGTMGEIERTMIFPDHHQYSVKELHELVEYFSSMPAKNRVIVTTAKDAMKLRQFTNLDEELKAAMYFIPVGVAFCESDEKSFNHQIINYVRNNRPDNILYKPKNKK